MRSGKNVCPLCNDDNHNRLPFDSKLCDSFGGFNYIIAKELTYESIINAMENHSLYASCGPQILSLTVEDGVANIEYKDAVSVSMTTHG
ncbi:MAG: PHP domain-containing protein, partial [Oscillospiraceae bacterium]|nr:PHP domain-containing protein [Candidatus Equicaccousia limihippi]